MWNVFIIFRRWSLFLKLRIIWGTLFRGRLWSSWWTFRNQSLPWLVCCFLKFQNNFYCSRNSIWRPLSCVQISKYTGYVRTEGCHSFPFILLSFKSIVRALSGIQHAFSSISLCQGMDNASWIWSSVPWIFSPAKVQEWISDVYKSSPWKRSYSWCKEPTRNNTGIQMAWNLQVLLCFPTDRVQNGLWFT